jgi:hypothetical protein
MKPSSSAKAGDPVRRGDSETPHNNQGNAGPGDDNWKFLRNSLPQKLKSAMPTGGKLRTLNCTYMHIVSE